MENNLEQLIDKSVKIRESLAKILVKNFPVEKEFADFLALDVVNQAIGTEALERYNKFQLEKENQKKLEKIRKQKAIRLEELKEWVVNKLRMGVAVIMIVVPVAALIWFVGGAVYRKATAPIYPRTYEVLNENTRFVDVSRLDWLGKEKTSGLNQENNLCIANYYVGVPEASAKTCIHRNKVAKLNESLQRAVDTDFNGVVWNEPNGNGEVWTIERNNYRFIITANKDENFINP